MDNTTYDISAPGLPIVPGPPVSTLIVAPVLTIAKSAPATVATGKTLTYTLTYGNTSGVDAPFVAIADPLPAGTTFVSANGGTPASAQAALIAGANLGEAYLNIHTSVAPGGEIRGFLRAAVPEPATWALMIGGFGLAGAALRRRRTAVAA